MTKNILVCGGGGFIGHHLAKRLKEQGNNITCVDIKTKEQASEFIPVTDYCDKYYSLDLSLIHSWNILTKYKFDEIYQLAADMGGAGYIFTGENDFNVMHNSGLINLHCSGFAINQKCKLFYSSSACMYPAYNQEDPENPNCAEESAYPAAPDSEYGWEKLFSERLYLAANRNYGLDIRIARFHNIFGPEGTWRGGKEKAPAALSRKIAELPPDKSIIDVWGDGKQTRSFLYIEECLDGIQRLMLSDCRVPLNIGSDEMVSINQLVEMIADIAGKPVSIRHIDGPLGVRGRNSDNKLIQARIGWKPSQPLRVGIEKTYNWIKKQNEQLPH